MLLQLNLIETENDTPWCIAAYLGDCKDNSPEEVEKKIDKAIKILVRSQVVTRRLRLKYGDDEKNWPQGTKRQKELSFMTEEQLMNRGAGK